MKCKKKKKSERERENFVALHSFIKLKIRIFYGHTYHEYHYKRDLHLGAHYKVLFNDSTSCLENIRHKYLAPVKILSPTGDWGGLCGSCVCDVLNIQSR